MKTNYVMTASVPSAYVTKNRQRIKQYDKTVYLNNGNEFELEFYNPTTNKVLAKIELNGKSLGSGIVLRPGERIFLERYLDDARKFLFETYTVEGDSFEVKQAIAKNGIVSVKFYNEEQTVIHSYWNNSSTTIVNPSWISTGSPYLGSTFTTTSATNLTGQSASPCYISSDVMSMHTNSTNGKRKKEKFTSPGVFVQERDDSIVETGRVEKGSHSEQLFSYDSSNFNSYYSWVSEWKILPLSQKPFVKEDLKVFCGQCGTKRKKDSHKFCPNCGEKY